MTIFFTSEAATRGSYGSIFLPPAWEIDTLDVYWYFVFWFVQRVKHQQEEKWLAKHVMVDFDLIIKCFKSLPLFIHW